MRKRRAVCSTVFPMPHTVKCTKPPVPWYEKAHFYVTASYTYISYYSDSRISSPPMQYMGCEATCWRCECTKTNHDLILFHIAPSAHLSSLSLSSPCTPSVGKKSSTKDMLSRVRDQRPSHNNSSWITSSVTVSQAKLLYYRAFARLYGIAGGCFASRVMVNSSWTRGHIAALWKPTPRPTVVFPPCDTSELEVSNIRNHIQGSIRGGEIRNIFLLGSVFLYYQKRLILMQQTYVVISLFWHVNKRCRTESLELVFATSETAYYARFFANVTFTTAVLSQHRPCQLMMGAENAVLCLSDNLGQRRITRYKSEL